MIEEGARVTLSPVTAGSFFSFFKLKNIFYLFYFWLFWVFVAVRGLSLAVVSGGSSLVATHRLLPVAASPVVEHKPWNLGSIAVVHGLSCPMAYGIFLGYGLNLCPLHWPADSYPLDHQGSPRITFSECTFYI